MAEAVTPAETPVPVPVAGQGPTRAERARSEGYRTRFVFVYFVLAVVVGAAVGAFAVVASRPKAAHAQSWSTWRPSGSDTAKIFQIADIVPRSYRLPNGDALAVAHPSAPTTETSSAQGQSVSVPVSQITVLPRLDNVDTTTSLQISLCGLGSNCKLVSGTPSTARYELLRREAVELALYTFEYVRPITSITVLMPPASNSNAAVAIFLPRTDVQDLLAKPLSRTLAETTPGVGEMPATEIATINAITRPRIYSYGFTTARDGTAIEILTPLA